MSNKTCVVVSVPLEHLKDQEEIIQKVSSIECTDLQLSLREVIFRTPEQLELESEDFEDEERQVSRIFATYSVSTAAWLRLGEDSLLDILAQCTPSGSVRKCEIWLTAPCVIPFFSSKVENLLLQDTEEDLKKFAEFGILIHTNALDSNTVEALHQVACHAIFEAEQAVAERRPDLLLGVDLFAFAEFSSRGSQRFDLLFSDEEERCNKVFEIARTAPWIALIKTVLGDEFCCMVSVVYSRPGSEAQDWHTDGAHIGRSSGWDDSAFEPTPPYAVCVFLALVDLDRTVGFTQFWPGTHRYSGLAGFGHAAPLLGCAVDAIVPAGGCVIYDYRLMHRGMPNTSVSTQRPLIQFLYHKPGYKETKNYGQTRLFDRRVSAGEALPTASA